jgi:DNA-binding HxlR family transcriptional regulator
MQRKSFQDVTCPIARGLERVGEWWSMLIMRDALQGISRFDELQHSLDIAPNTLTKRLNALVEAGLLERCQYSARPPRHEYVPTQRGRDFRPVLLAMMSWGNRHFAAEGPSVMLVDTRTGERVDPIMVDPATGQPIKAPDYMIIPGPGAGERTKQRYAARAAAAAETTQKTSQKTPSKPARGKSTAPRPAPSSEPDQRPIK